MDRVVIFDTTLRDGEQAAGATLNIQEKLEIASQLKRLGVDVIEAGFPASSAGDFEAVRAISREVRKPVICALTHANLQAIDRAWDAVKNARRARIHAFLSSSDIHMNYQLRRTRDEILSMTREAVLHAKKLCHDVEF